VAGDQITAAVEVYAPESAPAGAVVVAELDIRGSGSVRIAGLGRTEGQARSREFAFQLDTQKLPKGQYVLRIIATLPGTSERAERRIPFEVV
jgi:hypothetical protein